MHPDRGECGYRQFEFVPAGILRGGRLEPHHAQRMLRAVILTDHGRAGSCCAQPMHAAHVIPGNIGAQTMEGQPLIHGIRALAAIQVMAVPARRMRQCDSAWVDIYGAGRAELPVTGRQAKRPRMAKRQRPDRQSRSGRCVQFQVDLMGYAGGKRRNGHGVGDAADVQYEQGSMRDGNRGLHCQTDTYVMPLRRMAGIGFKVCRDAVPSNRHEHGRGQCNQRRHCDHQQFMPSHHPEHGKRYRAECSGKPTERGNTRQITRPNTIHGTPQEGLSQGLYMRCQHGDAATDPWHGRRAQKRAETHGETHHHGRLLSLPMDGTGTCSRMRRMTSLWETCEQIASAVRARR